MSGESIGRPSLMRLFEAARWAPSSFNHQPWRYLYALRDTDAWGTFFGLLNPGNQKWCENAGALVLACSITVTDDGKEIGSHAFDAGAAWENFALQGRSMGLVVHAMAGFDADRARAELSIPDAVAVHAMVAVGRPGHIESLPEGRQGGEKPNGRDPVKAFAQEGGFSA